MPLASCPNSCSGHGKCHAPHSEEPLVNVTAAVVAASGPAASGPAASGPAAPAAAVVPPALRFKETNLHLRSAVPVPLQVQQGSSTNQAVALIETSTRSTQSIQFMTRRGQRRKRGLFKTPPTAPTAPTVAPPIAPPTAPIAPVDPPFPPPADALAAPPPDDDNDDEAVCVCDDEWSGAACDLNQPTDAAPALNASATPTTPPVATPPVATPPVATPPDAMGHSFKRVHSHTKVVTDLAADVLAAVTARNRGQTTSTAPTVTIAPPMQTTPPTRTSVDVPPGGDDDDGDDGDDDTSATKAQDCRDNKQCNNQKNGVCKENRCYCLAGFTGDDCLTSTTTHLARRLKSFVSFDSSWHWVTVSLILGTFLGFMSDPVKRVCGQKPKFRRARNIHR